MRHQSDQADHVLRAYRYQLLHALQDWLDLGLDEVLLVEINEDHAVVSPQGEEATQIKFSSATPNPAPISLRSDGVVQALARFWDKSSASAADNTHLRILTNRTAAREKGAKFPGEQPGLMYWNAIRRSGDIAPLRAFLCDALKGTALGAWLASNPSDDAVRSRLLARVKFVLGAPDDAALERQLREQLGILYLKKGHYEGTAANAFPRLLDLVFKAASAPDLGARRLTAVELHRAIEEAIPRMGALIQAQLTHAPPETGISVTALVVRAGLCDRAVTVAEVAARTAEDAVTWLTGPNGVGKSTFAKLLARADGGNWLVCDFRPFSGSDASPGAIPVWRELIAALSVGPAPDGIILDDVSDRAIELLKNRLAGLAAAARVRGTKLILTSNHQPSPSLLADLGASASAAIEAPYFSVGDVRDLVQQGAAPAADMIEGWAKLIHVSTFGGHPQLVAAKVANLRARGWPDEGLAEDIVLPANAGVQATRAEARKRLLAELPQQGAARAVLERVSAVYHCIEDQLVRDLGSDAPAIPYPSDALVLLKGSWLEPLPDGGWRLSPLLSDLRAELAPARARRWQQIAAQYWLKKKSLDARTLPLCFWNAYLGRHPLVLMKVIEAIVMLPQGQVQSAAAMLAPLAVFRTDRPIFPDEPMISSQLRMLQVIVADGVEDHTSAAAAAERLLQEIDDVPVPELRELMTSLASKAVLDLQRVWLPARTQLRYLERLRSTVSRVMNGAFPRLKSSMQAMAEGLPEGASIPGLLLSGVFMRIRNSAHLYELMEALGELDAEVRTELIRSVEAILQDLGTFLHNAWANEQVSGKDPALTLDFYRRLRRLVAGWAMPDLEAELAIAESVILDEGLKEPEQSLALIEAAIAQFGSRPALVRQKSKVLAHQGRHDDAVSTLIAIEDKVGALPAFDRGLALRDGAVAAAKAARYEDALRLFRKADAAFAASPLRDGLRAGLIVEQALVFWQQGDRAEALRRAADALDAVACLDPSASRQALRSHVAARALIGLFDHDDHPYPKGSRPALAFGAASELQESEKPDQVALRPLHAFWPLLETIEADSGIDAGIAARSAQKKSARRFLMVEYELAKARYARALRSGDVEDAVRAVVPALSLQKRLSAARASPAAADLALLEVDAAELMPLDAAALVAAGAALELQHALVDIMLALALSNRWTPDHAHALQTAVSKHWLSDEVLRPLLRAADGVHDPDASMPAVIAFSLTTIKTEQELCPRDRVLRDLYWLYQAANGMGRRALEPVVVNALCEGWTRVLRDQAFMLKMPMRSAGEINRAMAGVRKGGMRAAPSLIEAAADASGIEISAQWKAFLTLLSAL